MSIERFELFSDGVFAIAMTLLVIELKVPHAKGEQLLAALFNLAPHFLAYATSFLVIGVLWLNHHVLFHFVKRVNRTSSILNLLLLMFVAYIPFATALVGDNSGEKVAVAFYGLSLAMTGVVYNILWLYVAASLLVGEAQMEPAAMRKATWWSLAYPVAYFVAAALAFVDIRVSAAIYITIPVYYLLPSAIDSRLKCFDDARQQKIRPENDESS
jgi:uncharacterized membrane protein